MDPWLERPGHFAGLHSQLVTYAVEQLQPQLVARGYFVAPNERVWITESQRDILPDGAILAWRTKTDREPVSVLEVDLPVRVRKTHSEFRQSFLEIFDEEHHRLITGIEFISPTNKAKSEGRRLYLQKQKELTAAGVNLVEVDLLRGGRHIALVPKPLAEAMRPWTYLVSVWRAEERDDFELYPIPLRMRLPRVGVPLKPGEADVVLNLQALLDRAYDAGPYRISVDYAKPPPGKLAEEDRQWLSTLVAK